MQVIVNEDGMLKTKHIHLKGEGKWSYCKEVDKEGKCKSMGIMEIKSGG